MPSHTHRATITLDQEAPLDSAAARLAQEFAGTFGPETIERFLHASYADLAATATVANYPPLLTEKFARQRLRALARVEDTERDCKPTALFLCVHNAGRSQMALGFFPALRRRQRRRLVRWLRTRRPGQPCGDRDDDRTRHRHLRRVPEALD